MDERRKLPRKYLVVYSRVFEQDQGNLLGYLCDLSLEGAMVLSEGQQDPGTVIMLRFDLPDIGASLFETEQMDINARVVYCQPDVSPTFNNIGFEFLKVTPEQKVYIERMMEKYEFNRDVPDYPTPPSILNDPE